MRRALDANTAGPASARCFGGSYPRAGWGDSISGRNVDREGAAMNQPETCEAPEAVHGRLDLQKELAEVLRQRAAISEVLRAIANSPHDLQPSPYSTPSSTAQCICVEQSWASSVLSRKQAFVSLRSKWAPC